MILSAVPRKVERVWGSLDSGGACPVGEVWWLYDCPDGSSMLLDAATARPAGTLAELAGRSRGSGPARFPLLVKTLHTADRLSVQVHPGAFGGADCKAETWLFLDVAPGSVVHAGLIPGCGRENLRALSETGGIACVLREWRVSKNDFMHLPPGTLHALGGGMEVLEIQRNCDVTYRLFDWNRNGADGRPRELHVDQAVACVDPEDGLPRLGSWGRVPRLDGAGYRLDCVEGGCVQMEHGWIFFVTSGTACGGIAGAPSCLVADGSCRLEVEGAGVLAVWEGP